MRVFRDGALADACSKRARPIVMTTIALGAGIMPIAKAVIGGLVTATLLSLFVVPVVFTYMDDLMEKFKNLHGCYLELGIKQI